jgi:membrane peptidoglycan carboxypeptidase
VKRPRGTLGLVLLTVPVLAAIGLAWGWWALAMPRGGGPPNVYLDIDGREIPSLETENGRIQMWVPLEHIPPSVAGAVIAAEDRRFMRHHGVDLPALAQAALTNTRETSIVRGASTITQQLARELFLTRERPGRARHAKSPSPSCSSSATRSPRSSKPI